MVSAAKLKKAQDRVVQIRPYANKLREVLVEVSSGLGKDHVGTYNQTRKADKILIVLIASNRGLCGAFNANICKRAMQLINEDYSAQAEAGNVKFYVITSYSIHYTKLYE